MMEKITITTEMLERANDYVSLMEKQEICEKIAPKCIAKVMMVFVPDGSEERIAVPDRWQEARHMTAMYQMGIFAKLYLNASFDGDSDLQMAANEYDKWAGSHVFNQLERLKGDKDLKDKVFNILYDYKEFQWALRREIETLLSHNNDVVARLAMFITESVGRGMLAASEVSEKREDVPSIADIQETAKKIEEMKERIQTLTAAQKEIQKANVELKNAQAAVGNKRELVDEFTVKLAQKKEAEVGANVRADK
jgi:hypothetical protein